MNDNRPTRSYTRLIIAIVIIVALTIAILVYTNPPGSGVTTSFPLGGTETFPTSSSTSIRSSPTPSNTVEFVQESNCYYGSWTLPWGVVLDGQTVAQPSNASLPLSYNGARLTGDSNYSTIFFSLPDGTYNYTIVPDDPLGSPQFGNVTVNGSNIEVQVYAFITAMGCSSTTTNPTSTTTSSVGTYNYTFMIWVNYTGPWKLTYQGYNNLGQSNPTGVSGSYNGTGFYSKAVTLTSLDTGGLTLCATAQKLDGSNGTLTLTVTGFNETSLPYGSVSYCGGVVP